MTNIFQNIKKLELKDLASHFKEDAHHVYDLINKHHDNLLEFIKNPNRNNINNLCEFSLVKLIAEGNAEDHIEKINQILQSQDEAFRVKSDGEIVGTGKYEVLDIGWSEAIITFLKNALESADFKDNPPIIQIEDDVVINIFGDFGTGDWEQSKVASTISQAIKNLNPSYSIHLGDVYYSGTSAESSSYLVSLWPTAAKGNFTLNSNHEMYDGARGYFNTTLTNKIFEQQKQNSYFALENRNWIIVGLDSAYFSDKKNLHMKGRINESQISFLREVANKNKKVIVLTHHNPIDNSGNNSEPILDQVYGALGSSLKYWYFGHTHCGAIYNDINNINFRLSGHSAVPYGNASDFANSSKVIWYENTPPVINAQKSLRVQNGFSIIRLSNENITEEFYGEDGKVHYSL
jgi:predicted phosphohydrolase